ncbi:unnamed protein product, partial [marine sediment metagenome]
STTGFIISLWRVFAHVYRTWSVYIIYTLFEKGEHYYETS